MAVIFNFNGSFELNKAAALSVACVNCSQAVTQVGWKIAEVGRWIKEDLVKSIRDMLAKRLIDYVVDQTIVWIQGGGKPKFITDWDGFLRDAANIAFDQIIKDVGLAWLCSPFELQLRLLLYPVDRFKQRIECTLDDVVKNIEDFYRDFEQGGWIAYQEAWMPQNNYYGQVLIIHDEVLRRTALKVGTAKGEAQAGRGFLSVKRCVKWETADYTGCVTECDAEFHTKEERTECTKNCAATRDAGRECLKEETVTPGSMVGEKVASAITSDKFWLANIQSWTTALVNALINRLVKEGIGLMKGSGSSQETYRPSEYQDVLDREMEREKQQMTNEVQRFINEWQYLLNAKNKSLSFEQLKQKACQQSAANQGIQTIQNEIDRLTNEIKDLQAKINEVNNLINQIKTADFFNIRQRELAQIAFEEFMNKYVTSELIDQIVSGSARQAADLEIQTKRTELEDVEMWHQFCR